MDASRLSDPGQQAVGALQRLVEREEPLALAHRALQRARAGQGSVLVLEGTGGMGKSTLFAAVRDAGSGGITLLSATGREPERDLAFSVVVQLFESQLAGVSERERARLLSGPARAALPLFFRHPGEPWPEGSFALLHGLWRLTANLAKPSGLAILVDDVDRADRPSLRFLLYLAERLQQVPVALLLSGGSAVRDPDPALLEHLTHHPAATRYRLQPLTERGTAEQLRNTWFAGASPYFCLAVHRATRGNPHLVGELARALWDMNVESDSVGGRRVHLAAPPSIAAGAIRRAALVGSGGPELLRAAAVLGDDAEVRHAGHLAGLDTDEALELTAGLAQAGLFEEGHRLRFAQPVVRAAVAASERPSHRAAVHLRAARLLMHEEAPAARIVPHLLHAPSSASPWAVEILRGAAAAALARGHPGTAISYLRRALEEPPSRDVRPQVLLELGRAEATGGQPEAVRRLQRAMDRVEDPDQRARAGLIAGRMLFAQGRHHESAATFRRALEEIGGGDPGLERLLRSGHAAVSRLDPHGSPPGDGHPPLNAGESTADRPLLAVLAMEAALRGDPRDRVLDLAARALAGGELLDAETADGISFYVASAALGLAEGLAEAEAALSAAVEDAKSRGSVLGIATASCLRGLALVRRGRLDDAAADARQALAGARQGWRLAIPAARAVLAQTLIERGELEAARKQLDLAELAAPDSHSGALELLDTRGRLHLLAGAADRALVDFYECRDCLEAIGSTNPALSPWRSSAARASAVLGDSTEAMRLAEEELALAEAFGAPGPVGRALRVLGEVGEGPAALEALEAAASRLEGSETQLEHARALVDFGGAMRRSGRRRAAREPLRRGLDLAERCGASALIGRALREMQAAGARPRRVAVRGRDALTARERQVSTLAARGLSNREIADTLFVTVKTVEWHLHQSFEKLEVKSRSELTQLVGDDEA